MKNTKRIGTTLLLIGIFILFRKVKIHCGFGGCSDDALGILLSSVVVMIVGLFFLNAKNFKLYLEKCNKKRI